MANNVTIDVRVNNNTHSGFTEVNVALEGLTQAAGTATNALGSGGGGAGGGGLTGALYGVGAVVGLSALPAIGALIPMMAGAALASQTLKLGFAGVGDAVALAGTNQKKYQQALDKMSPASRDFTKSIVGLKKEFQGLGGEIQKIMLPSFTKVIKEAGPLVKTLKGSMKDMAGVFADLAKNVGKLMKDSGFQKDFANTLKLGTGFIKDMTKNLVPLVKAIFDFGAKSKPTLDAFSGGFSKILSQGIPGFFKGLEKGISGSAKLFDGLFSSVNKIIISIGNLSGSMGNTFGPILGKIFEHIGNLVSAIVTFLTPAIDALKPLFDSMSGGMTSADGVMQKVAKTLGNVLAGAVKLAVVPLKNLYDIFTIAVPVVKDLAKAIVGPLSSAFLGMTGASDKMHTFNDSLKTWSNWSSTHKEEITAFFRAVSVVIMDMVIYTITNLPRMYDEYASVFKGIVTVLGWMVDAADKAFGWIPGIGPKIHEAAKSFDDYRDAVKTRLDETGKAIHAFSDKVKPGLEQNKLKLQISSWNAQIAVAKKNLKSVPKSKQAKLNADIAALKKKVDQAQAKLDKLHGKTVTVTVQTKIRGGTSLLDGGIFTRATGGAVGSSRAAGGGPRGNRVLVGEQGPEIVDLAPGSMVSSNPDTRRILGGGGGQSGPMHITLNIGDKTLGELIIDPIRKAVRTRGGNVQAVLGR
jgi:hypothetical protein